MLSTHRQVDKAAGMLITSVQTQAIPALSICLFFYERPMRKIISQNSASIKRSCSVYMLQRTSCLKAQSALVSAATDASSPLHLTLLSLQCLLHLQVRVCHILLYRICTHQSQQMASLYSILLNDNTVEATLKQRILFPGKMCMACLVLWHRLQLFLQLNPSTAHKVSRYMFGCVHLESRAQPAVVCSYPTPQPPGNPHYCMTCIA